MKCLTFLYPVNAWLKVMDVSFLTPYDHISDKKNFSKTSVIIPVCRT